MSKRDNRKTVLAIVVCLLIVGLSAWSIARQIPKPRPATASGGGYPGGPGGGPGGGQRPPGTRGQIAQISATSLTLQPRRGAAQTFTLTAATKITVDRQPATAASLKSGQRVRVVSKDNKTADEIVVRTRPFGGGPGGPGGRAGGYPGGPGGGPRAGG